MIVRVYCPNPDCGRRYKVDQSRLGRQTTCKSCGREFTLSVSGRETLRPDAQAGTADEAPGRAGGDVPAKLGRFEIRGRLGMGAFGSVYRAHDPVLDREVALKVPRATALERPEARARFLREPKAAAQLQHPHIVPVYDAGSDGQQYYIASAFIEGRTLEEVIEDEPPDFRRAAEIVRDLADALDYAHRVGVVHRDVKPANIMIDGRSQPLLMDFGLARLESSEEKLTQDGSVMGTPAYMAPEQADRSFGEVGPASDQYSLGVVLYELLSGRTPFSGPPAVLIHNALHQAPDSPRSIDPQVPRDLETICLKAMAKGPQERYAGCEELAADLRRWLADEPIRARRMGIIERTARWARRDPIVATLVLAVVLVTLVGLAAVTGQWRRAEVNRGLAEANLVEAQRQQHRAELNLGEANHQREAAEKNFTEAERQRKLAEKARREALQNLEEAKKQKAEAEEAQKRELRQRAEAEQASRDAEAAKQSAVASFKEAERQRQRAEQRERVVRHHLYAAEMNLAMQALETGNVQHVEELLEGQIPKSSEDQDLRSFEWYYLANQSGFRGRPRHKDPAVVLKHGPAVHRVAISPDQQALTSVGKDGSTRVWRLASYTSWKPEAPKDLEMRGAYLAGLWKARAGGGAPAGRIGWEGCLPYACSPHFLKMAKATSPGSIAFMLAYDEQLGAVSFLSKLATVLEENPLTKRKSPVKKYEPVRRVIVEERGSERRLVIPDASEPMAFSPDGRALAVTRWVREPQRRPYLLPYNYDVIVHRKTIEVRDLANESVIRSCGLDGISAVFSIALSPGGKALAIVEPQQALSYEAKPAGLKAEESDRLSTAKVTLLSGNGQPITAEIAPESLLFSTDGSKLLAHAPSDRLAVLFDASAARAWRIAGLEEEAIALSPDGQIIAMGYKPLGQDVKRPRPRTKLAKIKAGLRGELDLQSHRAVQLWDVTNRRVRTVLGGHRYTVRAAAFSPDGKTIATGGEDATIRLWDTLTGIQRFTLKGHKQGVLCLVFSADGTALVSGSRDGTILVWRAETSQKNRDRTKQDK